MHFFVTGGAGFIGSNLTDRLLQQGHQVTVYDNFSTGMEEFLKDASVRNGFRLHRGDLLKSEDLEKAMVGCDFVYHLAANADIRGGTAQPRKDLEQNTLATFNVLEVMRRLGLKDIVFTSTGAMYGEAKVIPTPEDSPIPVQTSLYGASKLACESMIEAYCEGFGFRSWIFRLVSALGERYTHGHVFDFYRKLLQNPDELEVLGNGQQKKSYIYIQDFLDAVQLAVERSRDKVNIYNIGIDNFCQVKDSVYWITEYLGLKPRIRYAGGDRGWIGDNPFVYLNTARIRSMGWAPKLSIQQGVIATIRYLEENRWLLERR